MTTNRSQIIFPSKVPIIYIGVILFMTKSNHQFIPLLSKYFNTASKHTAKPYRREASKHTAKPYDASAVGLDYILSTRCPKALRTHNHLVSEPSSLRGSLAADCPYPLRFYLINRRLIVNEVHLGTAINRVPNFHLHRNSGSRDTKDVPAI